MPLVGVFDGKMAGKVLLSVFSTAKSRANRRRGAFSSQNMVFYCKFYHDRHRTEAGAEVWNWSLEQLRDGHRAGTGVGIRQQRSKSDPSFKRATQKAPAA